MEGTARSTTGMARTTANWARTERGSRNRHHTECDALPINGNTCHLCIVMLSPYLLRADLLVASDAAFHAMEGSERQHAFFPRSP